MLDEKLKYKNIELFGQSIPIRSYACSTNPNETYLSDYRFALYIKITDICNTKCNYCSNTIYDKGIEQIDLYKLEIVIKELYEKGLLSRISITGGEPLLDIDNLNRVLNTIFRIIPDAYITFNTNGINFHNINNIETLDKIEEIHISRHHYDNHINDSIFGVKTASNEDIEQLYNSIQNKRILRYNCLLMKKYIDNQKEVIKFLEESSKIGISQVIFVSLMKVNNYCLEHFINFNDIFNNLDKTKFFDSNHFYDSTICECKNGLYLTNNGDLIEYYARMTKDLNCDYTRAFVYNSSNKLTLGFGKKEILIP